MSDDWSRLPAALSAWIDASYPLGLDPEAHMWRRIRKVANEYGETLDAIEGAIGENPRKGVCATWEDVERELFDVALSALGAAEHLRGNTGEVPERFIEHVRFVCARAGLAIS